MLSFIYAHLDHTLCFLILIARIGDIGSTYLVTPTLQLEANPIMRRLGWRFALITLLICLVPYYSQLLGLIVLVPSLLVSSSNINAIWMVRALGETVYVQHLESVVRRSTLGRALAGVFASSFFHRAGWMDPLDPH